MIAAEHRASVCMNIHDDAREFVDVTIFRSFPITHKYIVT